MRRLLLLLVAVCALLVAACGDSEEGTRPAPPEPTAASPADFPAVTGRALPAITKGLREGPIMALAVNQIKVGANRVAFVLVDRARKQIDVDAVAVYTADGKGRDVKGPYVAHKESLEVATQYRSTLTAGDLANGSTFYVARVPFAKHGQRTIMGLARLDGRLVVAGATQGLQVGGQGGPPAVGEKATRIHTETASDVGGDYAKISTRVPAPKAMLDTDFADVVGKKPVVLVFATPQLCASRTCGPVVDIAEQVRATSGKGVTFIQQEIYNDNQVNKGFRPQVEAWRLPTEPWAFVIDRRGRVSSRFEGVFSVGELSRAVAKVQ